jgi:hypothetical protein
LRLGARSINEKFSVLHALAIFGNQLILPPDLLRLAGASKLRGEITGHLFYLKLNAYSSPNLIFQTGKQRSDRLFAP